MKERLYHVHSNTEKTLISQTNLFPSNEEIIKSILGSIRLVKYHPSRLILKEGETGGDAIYMVQNGSVRVFTYDSNGIKIPLARLESGDYFGEQTLLSDLHKTRSANVESITPVTLIRIDAKSFITLLRDDPEFRKKIGILGDAQAFSRLLAMSEYEKSPWLSAIIKKDKKHNSNIQSYSIKLSHDKFDSFYTGQYVMIRAKMGEYWLERPYTVSDLPVENELRITIKYNPESIFTEWLFHRAPDELNIFVTQPRGSFILNLNSDSNILCFAGGIGITPFITFAKAFAFQNRKSDKMHILYSALNELDFIFKDEFSSIAQSTPSFSVRYRATDKEGLLSEKEIIKVVDSFNRPDIYICGPEGFIKLVQDALLSIRYDAKKIKIDQYVHAG